MLNYISSRHEVSLNEITGTVQKRAMYHVFLHSYNVCYYNSPMPAWNLVRHSAFTAKPAQNALQKGQNELWFL